MKKTLSLLFQMLAVIVLLSACASPRSSSRSVVYRDPPPPPPPAMVVQGEEDPQIWWDTEDVPLPDFDSAVPPVISDLPPPPSRGPLLSGCAELDQTLAETRLILDDVIASVDRLGPDRQEAHLLNP